MASLRIEPGAPEDFKDYMGRLVKLIPSEVLSIYLIGQGVIPQGINIALAAWAVVCLLLVFLARAYATSDPSQHQKPQVGAILISVVSFVIWIYTMGGPFAAYNIWIPWLATLVVLVWTFLVPFLYRPK